MNPQTLIRVLLVEDNPGDARLLREMFSEVDTRLRLTHAEQLSEAFQHLREATFDVVLLDLSLPDSNGLETLEQTVERAPEVPIVVLTGLDDETVGLRAVKEGAQDYLFKDQIGAHLLVRALHYAIERHQLHARLRSLMLTDDLTGLYNRRGFFTLAEQQMKLAERTGEAFLLIYIDLNNLKRLNDTFGHQQGDRALQETAEILQRAFRESDLIARVGGDEFVVLAIDACPNDTDTVIGRLGDALEAHNATRDRRFRLSMSVGVAGYDPESPTSIDKLLSQADREMYQAKQQQNTAQAENGNNALIWGTT